MLSKTLIASAEKPAGPVTLASRPPPGSETSLRRALTGSRIVSVSPLPVMTDVRIAAVPSREGAGFDSAVVAWKGRATAGSEDARFFASSALNATRSSSIRFSSPSSSPPSRR